MNEKQWSLELLLALVDRMQELLNQLKRLLLDGPNSADEKWHFPENNYTVLAIWLLYDPKAHRLFPVSEKKSWNELAQRLSKYVGWTVDEHILRQNYTRNYLKIRKKE